MQKLRNNYPFIEGVCKMQKQTKILLVVLVLLSLVLVGCSGRNTAIGTVDMTKVSEQSNLLKVKQTEMQEKIKQAEKELMDASEKSSKEEMEKLQNAKGLELRAYQERMQNEVKQTIETVLSEVAKDKKLGAVLIKDAVPHGGVDVTEDVITKLNQLLAKPETKAETKPAEANPATKK